MKITLTQLKKIIREELTQDTIPPGKWGGGGGSVPVADMERLGRDFTVTSRRKKKKRAPAPESLPSNVLAEFIKEAFLQEMGGPAMASGTDPVDVKGFYPYEIERGADIHGYWYRSPGRSMGSDGDFRPSNALEYIGMSRPSSGGEAEVEGGDAGETSVSDSTPNVSPEITK
jgi:hypothetical protein